MPRSVYSITAEAALRGHFREIEKLLATGAPTPAIERAIREHLEVVRESVQSAYEHALASGHLSREFQNEHQRRVELITAMEARLNELFGDGRSGTPEVPS